MKKKLVFMAGGIAICAASVFTSNIGMRSESLSDIALANLEALAENESGGNLRWGKHPCPGWWFLNGSEQCCISNGENNPCSDPSACTGC